MKVMIMVLIFVVSLAYAVPLLACDCDTAAALTMGLQDRLHQTWPGDAQRSDEKAKNTENGPKQETQPINQDTQTKGEVKR
jgi:hypothetical protein